MGRARAGSGARAGSPDPALDRLLRLPLVPRDGARVVRGRGDRAADERAVRVHQARPRGAPGHRLDLHGGLPGDDRRGWLAAERLHHAGAGPDLHRHLLPARVAHGHAELARSARGGGAGVGREARRDPRRRRRDRRAPAGRRRATRIERAAPGGAARLSGRGPARAVRPRQRRLWPGAQVPARVGARVPDAPRRGRHGRADPARDGVGRHVRPDRWRLRALLGGPLLARPPLREDALRQRAARARVPARLAGDRRSAVPPRDRGDARLGAERDARARGRLLLRPRRRLRGRGGQVLRLECRRAARGARRRAGRRGGDRLVRRHRPRQLRGRQHPGARPGRTGAAGRLATASLRRALASASGPGSTTSD